jgi:predicted transcriptional regulator
MLSITETLEKARLEAGISQVALARAIGVTPQYISDIVRGRRELPAKHYAKLPDSIRRAVVKAALLELEHARDLLKALLE